MSHKYVWYSLMINFTDGSLKKIHKHECRPQLGSHPGDWHTVTSFNVSWEFVYVWAD